MSTTNEDALIACENALIAYAEKQHGQSSNNRQQFIKLGIEYLVEDTMERLSKFPTKTGTQLSETRSQWSEKKTLPPLTALNDNTYNLVFNSDYLLGALEDIAVTEVKLRLNIGDMNQNRRDFTKQAVKMIGGNPNLIPAINALKACVEQTLQENLGIIPEQTISR